VIGAGIMGFNNVRTALQVPGVELVAACDLYDGRLTRVQEVHGKSIYTTRDYREILNRKDIDAVIVATSDHWHDKISIDALKAGKAVYCEKPMVHQIEEGQAVVAAAQKAKVPMMVGSQRVSSIIFEKAREIFEAGDLGELVMVEAWIDRQSANGAWQYSIPTDASPETVDWDRYLGDAPKQEFDAKRFFRWRNYQDYGTGVSGDLFVHLISGLHMITGSYGPNRIYASGGLRFWKDGRDVPDVVMAIYDYPKTDRHPAFNVQMRVNFIDGGGGGQQTRLVGTEGVMTIGWSDITVTRSPMAKAPGYGGWDTYMTFSEAQQKDFAKAYAKEYPAEPPRMQAPNTMTYSAPEGYNDHFDHWSNFIEAIHTGKPVVEDAAFGFRAAAPALLINKSYFEQKVIHWDPEKMKLV
ncbi:MAG: Gfo/Idh/MocA family oxidoreductase, partial [Bacteroidota bacterium]